jgi:hypothetical protein
MIWISPHDSSQVGVLEIARIRGAGRGRPRVF